MNIRLYSPEEISHIPRPANPNTRIVYEYVVPLMRDGTARYIDNVNTKLYLLVYGDLYLPVTVNETEWENSYVCSPYTHYITYAAEELAVLPTKIARSFLGSVIRVTGNLLKAGDINRVVIVNNWLLSTNLYPDLPDNAFLEITDFLRKRFPQHSLMFRSLNEEQHKSQLKILARLGYTLVGSRQVYLWDTNKQEDLSYDARKHLRADEHRLKDSLYTTGQINMDSDSERSAELYSFLYLNKYSFNNPRFNSRYMQLCSASGIFHFTGLYEGNTLMGVAGILHLGNTQTAPVLGYDTSRPKRDALYRRLSMITYLSAKEGRAYFNNSSGVSDFKRFRGCFPAIEYSAVLPSSLKQRIAWIFLRFVVNGIGIPLMRYYRL